jgi:hypothetical protein
MHLVISSDLRLSTKHTSNGKGAPQFCLMKITKLPKISQIFHIFTILPIYIQIFFLPCASSANLRAENPSMNLRAGESRRLSLKAAYRGKFDFFFFNFYIILFF